MKSIGSVLLVGACAIGCGGSFSGGDGLNGAGGLASGAGSSAGGALVAGAGAGDDVGGAAQSGAGGSARAGADSGGQAGAAGGSGGACNGIGSGAPAQPLKFVLQTNTSVYVKQTCTLNYQLTSTCTGSTPLTTQASCVSECSDRTVGCIACGACFSGALEVTPIAPQEISWSGNLYEFGTAPNGCACATGHAAPPGEYTVSIDAYLSADDAINETNAFHHRVDFTLPAPNDTVIVDLGFTGI